MERTIKKTKSKGQYRFLRKEHSKEPLKYIKEFYSANQIEGWQEQSYLFLTSSSGRKRKPLSAPFVVYRNLINHIDCAYILGQKLGGTSPASRLLEVFFLRMSRDRWIAHLDKLMEQAAARGAEMGSEDNYNQHLLSCIELFYYLNHYFYLLAQGEEQHFAIPLYIFDESELKDEEKSASELERLTDKNANRISTSLNPFLYVGKVYSPIFKLEEESTVTNLQYFFDIADIDDWKRELRHWYEAIYQESVPDQRLLNVDFLFSYTLIVVLLELYFLLIDSQELAHSINKDTILLETPTIYALKKDEKLAFHYVSRHDCDNALEAVLTTVQAWNQEEWENMMYDWLSFSLTSHSIKERQENDSNAKTYQLLNRIIELSYIIAFEEELNFTNLKQ